MLSMLAALRLSMRAGSCLWFGDVNGSITSTTVYDCTVAVDYDVRNLPLVMKTQTTQSPDSPVHACSIELEFETETLPVAVKS